MLFLLTRTSYYLATQPEITWSVEPTQTASVAPFSYTLSISGEYPCASHTILNPPQCSHNPDFDLTSENWIDANVDQRLYEWWFDYPDDECNLTALGTHGLKNLSPPNTSNNLVSDYFKQFQEMGLTHPLGI